MKTNLVRIGRDYYNLDFLVAASSVDDETYLLTFVDNISVRASRESWFDILKTKWAEILSSPGYRHSMPELDSPDEPFQYD